MLSDNNATLRAYRGRKFLGNFPLNRTGRVCKNFPSDTTGRGGNVIKLSLKQDRMCEYYTFLHLFRLYAFFLWLSDNNATLVAYSEYQERECWKTFPHSGQSVGLILFFLTCNSQCRAILMSLSGHTEMSPRAFTECEPHWWHLNLWAKWWG